MNARYLVVGAAAAALGASVGCNDSGEDVDANAGAGANATATLSTSMTTTTSGMGGVGDGNDSFEDAVSVTLGQNILGNALDPPATDEDYFKFDVSEGDLVLVLTDAKPSADEFDPTYVDLVVTLYDSNHQKVAENDNPFLVRGSNDSQVWYRAPSSGEYFLRVTECTAWDLGGPSNCADAANIVNLEYGLQVAILDPAEDGQLEDSEGGDAFNANPNVMEYVPNPRFNYYATVTWGTFDTATDIDVYELTIRNDLNLGNDTVPWGTAYINGPPGTNGIGTTNTAGRVWITDSTGSNIIAEIDHSVGNTDGPREIRARMAANGTYFLHVEHPRTALGSNDWYLFNYNEGDTNPLENEAINDTSPGHTLTTAPSGQLHSAFIAGTTSNTDDDFFTLTLPAGNFTRFNAACAAHRSGSGVRGLTIEVRDSVGTVLDTAGPETEAADLILEDLDVSGESSVTVHIVAAYPPAGGSLQNHYYCGFHFGPPQ